MKEKISRNLSVLQFQRRLIRTARNSPKLEALNLFGIVYSNLMEFFQVRVPLDDNRSFIMDEWADTFDMFCQAVRNSFINLFISNEIEVVGDSIIQKLLHQRAGQKYYTLGADDQIMVLKSICVDDSQLAKTIHGEEPGLFVFNQFYHRFTVARSLVQFWDESDAMKAECKAKIPAGVVKLVNEARNLKPEIVMTCSRNNISMPSAASLRLFRTQEDFLRFATKWVNDRKDPYYAVARLVMRLETHDLSNDIDSEDMSEARSFTPDDAPGGGSPFYVYNFGIKLDNPIFFDFDKVARKIMKNDGVDPYPTLRYMEDGLDDYHGIYFLSPDLGTIGCNFRTDNDHLLNERVAISCEHNEPIMIRTPVRTIENAVPKTICMALFGDQNLTEQLFACQTFREIKELATRKDIIQLVRSRITTARLTLYRTGKIRKQSKSNSAFIEDANAKLVIFIAFACRKDAHIYVECRARDDELNNLWLVRLLQKITDINVVNSRYREFKVHAKLWSFRGPNGQSLSVVSTGNFSDSAQSNFSDTYLIVPSRTPSEKDTATMLNREIWLAMGLAGVGGNVNLDEAYDAYNVLIRGRHPFVSIVGAARHPRGTIQHILNSYRRYETSEEPHKLRIRLKCNHITDPRCIQLINAAASAGCKVDVMVRTTSTISMMDRPHNLRVRSIMGRYLEHDRIFIVEEYGISDVYIGSADLMTRNLKHRVESLVRIPTEWAAFKKILIRTFDDMFERETDPKAGFFNYKV